MSFGSWNLCRRKERASGKKNELVVLGKRPPKIVQEIKLDNMKNPKPLQEQKNGEEMIFNVYWKNNVFRLLEQASS